MMFPSMNAFFIWTHYSHPQTNLHQVEYSVLWHLNASLISIPPLPAFCPFQVPVPLASWGSRCLVIAYLETPSTQPLGWNPLASVRREIVCLRGQGFCLSAGGNCRITCTRSAREMINEWPLFTLSDHKTVVPGLATFAFVATVYWSLFFPLAQF